MEEGWLDSGLPFIRTPDHKSVHTQTHMFTEYATGEYELYDLNADPYQLDSKPRAGNEQLYSDLQARLNALKACSGAGCRTAEWAGAPPPGGDTTAPTVTSTLPTANATGVAPTTNVKATFSEDMLASSINATTFKLFKKGSTSKLAASVSYDAGTHKATLDPTNSLRSGVTYKAVVTTGAKDLTGNFLDQQYRWFFTVN